MVTLTANGKAARFALQTVRAPSAKAVRETSFGFPTASGRSRRQVPYGKRQGKTLNDKFADSPRSIPDRLRGIERQ